MKRKPLARKHDPYWWGLHESEIQEVAQRRIGRRLTSQELRKGADAFSEGSHWMDVIETIVDMYGNQYEKGYQDAHRHRQEQSNQGPW